MSESKKPVPGKNSRRVQKSVQKKTASGNSSNGSMNGAVDKEQLLDVLIALKQGDLTTRMPSNLTGVEGKIADTLNEIMDQHELMIHELEGINKKIGKKGKLQKRISNNSFTGSWEVMIDSVNTLIDNLTWPTTEMARVIDSIAKGDLTQEMDTEKDGERLKGDYLRTARTVNRMIEQLNLLSLEVTRVIREIGLEGKLGGQASVKGASGVWNNLVKELNQMSGNLTDQVRSVTEVTTAVAKGDFSKKVSVELKGETKKLKETINSMVDQLSSVASEVTRVSREVGNAGHLGGQAYVPGVSGSWKDLTDNVNLMIDNLTNQVRNFAEVTTAVAKGDLSKKVTVSVKGEVYDLKETINTMVDQLNAFASEVNRVAREVGTEGQLGGQAKVKEISGIWKDLTDNVNLLSANLTSQVRDIAEVTTAVAKGDLSKKITVDARGEILDLKRTINTMVYQLGLFTSEVTRVTHEVGTEGKLGGQAKVRGISGTWADLTDNVNLMANNLTNQVRSIAEVTTALAQGDLSKKVTVSVKGEIQELKETINTMVDQLSTFSSEVTRVAREVGTDGKLGGQAYVPDVSGIWKGMTDNVNHLAGNLTVQLRDVSKVATAIAQGDLSKKITIQAQGEILEIKETINSMVDLLSTFADQVTTVSNEVGLQGKLGGQARVKGASGTWAHLTNSVNMMATSLTDQVRNIAEVTTAVARGDLSKKVSVEVKGEFQELKQTINTMVDQLNSFASEVTRVTRYMGTKGILGGQADVPGVSGIWEDLTENVNQLSGNLTVQLRDVSKAAKAVAEGNLSKKITVDAQGEIQELKETINTMIDQLNSFSSEVKRVTREVSIEGKLGGQVEIKGISGTWEDLTDNINLMTGNLTEQMRSIAEVTNAVSNGDLSRKITINVKGEVQELKGTINSMVDQLSSFASEVTRVVREVGTEGKLGGQAHVPGAAGTWKYITDDVNQLAGNLTVQLRDVSKVATAIAQGDLSRKITVDVKGEILQIKEMINTMVDQLNSFASEVTRVAREVGTEGELGGQAKVAGVSGTWKDLTDNVNMMASNLTDQVRGIAKIVTAVANGDLTKKLMVEAKGEVAQLTDTINNMIDNLATFADQVTTLAREVGMEGKLGGQADVPGASGIWANLTGNVNQLADNLTTQVRAITDVATAVTEGDLTRSITVNANGEVDKLKNNINEMIRNLRETTEKNVEQDWLKTNLAKFSRMLQGQQDLQEASRVLLSELAPVVSAQHAIFYGMQENADKTESPILKLLATYGYRDRVSRPKEFKIGEGLIGQCALEKELTLLNDVPGDYIQISSGLGEAPPVNIAILPVMFEGHVKGVIELASFEKFNETHLTFFDQLTENIGIVYNTIETTVRTEALLEQSQLLAGELQNRQDELQQTNEELEEKARLLAEQKEEVESKNQQVEYAKQALEEKATQLQLTSKYKSEFLANMSHELRTPLNSLLILSEKLKKNEGDNLDKKQVEFSETIHAAGTDLLNLINDILDLSKIESGTVSVDPSEVRIEGIKEEIERTFRHMIDTKKDLDFSIEISNGLPDRLVTDSKRLQQILRNLLSNSFKFTKKGIIELRVSKAIRGWSFDSETLDEADSVIAFKVRDTGTGISSEKQEIIFEAFQQADGSTSRRFEGTGLGLTISREIANLLGGELCLTESEPGKGSTFTLFLPQTFPFQEPEGNSQIPSDGGAKMKPKNKGKAKPGTKTKTTKNGASTGKNKNSGPKKSSGKPVSKKNSVKDDRKIIKDEDRVLLIIEEDEKFASGLLDIARKKNFKGIVANGGHEGLSLAREYRPTAITLDLRLNDIDGWTVLDRLKLDHNTRHIPVSIISSEKDEHFGLTKGGFSYLQKPAKKKDLEKALDDLIEFLDKKVSKLLVVTDNKKQQKNITELIENEDVEIITAETGDQAIDNLKTKSFQCMVLDLYLKDKKGFTVLEELKKIPALRRLPAIIYTRKNLTEKDESRLNKMSDALIIKSVRSQEHLLDETSLYLHRIAGHLPQEQQKMLEKNGKANEILSGKKVLVVDDDIRNVFALTSILEEQKMHVLPAENGREALDVLEKHPDFDLILMDIMMPEMDGYETIQAIRKNSSFTTLPILAVTAKAMKGDREKCLEAGASDYITKPVNEDHLLSLMQVWLYK